MTSKQASMMRALVAVLLTAALLKSGGDAATEEAKAKGAPVWVQPGLRRLLGNRRHKVDAIVERNGGGGHHFGTIGQALAAAPETGRYVIHIRAGIYHEVVNITRNNVTLIGDGMGRTVVTGNQSKHTGHNTLTSAVVSVYGSGFMARDLTVQNTAGVAAGPAVAFMSISDRSIYYRCEFDGFQDTLNADCNRQFYLSCNVSGNVDFVFGHARAVFQDCNLLVRPPAQGSGHCVVTAQGREAPDDRAWSGFVFQDSTVMPLPGVHLGGVRTYLGRPWKDQSFVVFMSCDLYGIVDPAGWEKWNDRQVQGTVFYAEFENRGPGADTKNRVDWPEFHLLKDRAEATKFTVQKFIQGDEWLPAFGVKYKSGMN